MIVKVPIQLIQAPYREVDLYELLERHNSLVSDSTLSQQLTLIVRPDGTIALNTRYSGSVYSNPADVVLALEKAIERLLR